MKELKVGDQVQINAVEDSVAEWLPKVLGSHVTIIGIAPDGDAAFVNSDELEEGCPFQRCEPELLFINVERGWEYEIL